MSALRDRGKFVSQYQNISPQDDSRAFRGALGKYGTGVAVITTVLSGKPVGMTVNSFAAVSLDPALILWSVQNSSSRVEVFAQATHFAVNVLSVDQLDISRAVASPDAATSAFETFEWSEGARGVPLIEGAIARFECSTDQVLPGGDHQIILGRVDKVSEREGESLLFVQGSYARTEAFPVPAADDLTPDGEPATDSLMQLLNTANHRLSRAFDEHRNMFGLNAANSRVLKRLSAGPMSIEALGESSFLTPQSALDAIAELSESGLVTWRDGLFEQSDKGREVRAQIAQNARQFNESVLSRFAPQDVSAIQRVLSEIVNF